MGFRDRVSSLKPWPTGTQAVHPCWQRCQALRCRWHLLLCEGDHKHALAQLRHAQLVRRQMRPIDGVANCLDAEAPLVPQPKTKLVGNFWDSLWTLNEPPKGRDSKMRRLASKALTNAGPLLSNSAKPSERLHRLAFAAMSCEKDNCLPMYQRARRCITYITKQSTECIQAGPTLQCPARIAVPSAKSVALIYQPCSASNDAFNMQQSDVCQSVIAFTQWALNLPSAYIPLLFAYVSVSAREFRVTRTWARANVRARV